MAYETILTETHGPVRLIRLNRPEALNALSVQLIKDLNAALDEAEAAQEIRCIILTGSEKAFAAGADVKEMQSKTYLDGYLNFLLFVVVQYRLNHHQKRKQYFSFLKRCQRLLALSL